MDKLRNDTRLMVRIVRIPDYFRSQNLIPFHIDKGIEWTSSKMGTEGSLKTVTIFRSQCDSLHLFTSCFFKMVRKFFSFHFALYLFKTNILLTAMGYLLEGPGCLRIRVGHHKWHSSITISDHFRIDGNPPKKGNLHVTGSFFSPAGFEKRNLFMAVRTFQSTHKEIPLFKT